MSKELTQYDFPGDLKKMDLKEMELLSYAIRDFLIDKVSKTGGHLASNLGVVELTIALHKVFNSPEDKMIWDVGHQSYVHKILTGRAGEFDGLRQMNGISGFPKGKESPHDAFDTGHSSNSISAAAGMAAARDLKGDKNEVIAIIGDGSLTGGMAYEGLNNVGASKSKMIVILNDNGMSISRNIGGVSQHLSKLRTSNGYLRVKKTIKRALNRIPVIGDDLSTNIGHAKDRIKYALLSGGVIFEELGSTYLGPINGHNIRETIEVLELAKHVNGPVFIHVMTKKGRGYRTAEIDPNKFHGISPFNPETGKVLKPSGMTYSKVLGATVEAMAADDKKITTISAAMCDATGLSGFAKKYPRQFFDVGIAEAHCVTFAAGLAKSGMKPLVAIYSSFLQRAYDQIIEDVCIQNLPVVFAIDRAGIVGADGETHHGLFDIAYLTSMPNMTVLAPSNGNQLAAMIRYAFTLDGPVAIRYPRGDCSYNPQDTPVFDGKNQRIFTGKDLDIWAVGKMLQTALETREQLKRRGIDAGVVEAAAIKPLDLSCLTEKTKPVVTIEDGLLAGGFGDKFIVESQVQDVLTFGWPDQFVEHGDCDSLYKKYGLDADSITERICEHFERKA